MTNEECLSLREMVKAAARHFHPRVSEYVDVEDLEQEAWLRAIQACESKDKNNEASLKTYVYPAVRSACLNTIKKHKPKVSMLYLDAPIGDEDENSSEPQSLHDIIGRPDNQTVAVEALEAFEFIESTHPRFVADSIRMRAEGYSNQEIATAVGKTVAAVEKMFSRMYAAHGEEKG